MKLSRTSVSRVSLATLLFSAIPFIASAQAITDVPSLFNFALNVLNVYVVPIIFALAFVMFLLGVYRYFIAGGASEEKVAEGQKFVLWSVVGFVVMFSIWGIINLFINSFGFDNADRPAFPTFGGVTNTTGLTTDSSDPFSALLGGSSSGSLVAGQSTLSSGGYTYVANGTNSYSAVNGTCPPGYSLSGVSSCVASGSSSSSGPLCFMGIGCSSSTANGSGSNGSASPAGQPGGSCKQDSDCADVNGTSYGCYQGTCTVNGDPPADGTVQPGGACTNDNSCADVNGTSYGCNNGICTVNGNAAADGTVQPGGACTNDNSCADVNGVSYGCNNGICTVNGTTAADGTVQPGGACTNDNSCADVNGTSYGCNNGICTANGNAASAGQPGSSCSSDSDCADINGQSYGCFNGTCTLNGDAPNSAASSGGNGGD